MATCKLCSKEDPLDGLNDMQFCKDCARLHAIGERTEPLRPFIPCIRCNGGSFVRGLVLRERAATGGDHARAYIAPLAVTYDNAVRHTLFRGREVKTPETALPLGVFETYTCRGCGYLELYARDASDIPIGPEYGTELFEVPSEGPYR